jgi:integrase
MSRPKSRVRLTAARVESFKCCQGKSQDFLWDTESPALVLRVTPTGRKTFAFEGRLNGETIRMGIGAVADWTLDKARQKASEFKMLVDTGRDPREVERSRHAEATARRVLERAQAISVAEAWKVYVEERRPHWGETHYLSHLEKARPGGELSRRRGMTDQLTKPGPLAPLMPLALKDLTSAAIESWAAQEGAQRPTSARLAWRLLNVFLNWCSEHPQYGAIVPDKNPAKTKRAKESLGKSGVKNDVLTREQLPSWFQAVRQIQNPTISAYLQILLLTGARPGDLLDLCWTDVDTQWKSLTIRDKIEGERIIPLTSYVKGLLDSLPHHNQWVFASTRTLQMDTHNVHRRNAKALRRGELAPVDEVLETSKSGRIAKPNTPHTRACKAAGINGLTLHGLRRSFSSLTEWLEIPAGVVAQIQGHKPSATAEKHYKRRPLDLLRLHHERIETWLLEQSAPTTSSPK